VVGSEAADPFADALLAQLPQLRRYAAALSGNLSLADDLVQDCIERALRQAAHLKERERLGSWLRSILYNLFIDEIRRRRVRGIEKEITELADDQALAQPASDRGQVRDFLRAMDGLSPEHRQILLLVGLEDMSYREIASELKIPIGTVMSRIARARERLRSALEDGATASNVSAFPLRRSAEP
jgi:RNA polymerase sigma-70 factor (ECF subfamily)